MIMDEMKLPPSLFKFLVGEGYSFSDLECYDPNIAVKILELMVKKKNLF